MLDAFKALLGSRKAMITILAIVAITILAGLGRVAAEPAMEFLKWIVIAWLGAQAYEDGAIKSAALRAGVTAPDAPKPTADDP